MINLVVRQAVLADLDALVDIFDQYRQFQGKTSAPAACRSFLLERLNHGQSVLFLATSPSAPIGLAQLYPMFSSTELARVFVLNDLFVAPSGRRAGVATELLNAIEQYARSFGACRLSLNVARDIATAQSLYEASGWVRDSQFHVYHRYPERAGAD